VSGSGIVTVASPLGTSSCEAGSSSGIMIGLKQEPSSLILAGFVGVACLDRCCGIV